MAVKIFDACQSGAPYIKDANDGFEKSLKSSKLKSFICMSSSKQNQSSFASATESHFTARWIDAALAKQEGKVLYRDIQAALADAFVASPEQTPFFVNQGTGLEIFSEVTLEMRNLATNRKKSATPEQPDEDLSGIIAMAVNRREKEYVEYETALDAISRSMESFSNYTVQDNIVNQFYEFKFNFDRKLPSIPRCKEVASFAQDQDWEKRYFIQIEEEAYKVRVPKDNIPNIAMFGIGRRKLDDSETVIETKYRPVSLESTEQLPFEVAVIEYTTEHRSLPQFLSVIGLVHSLTEVMVISSIVRLRQTGWDRQAIEYTQMKWKYESYSWTRVVEEPVIVWSHALTSNEKTIRTLLENLVPKDTQEEDNSEGKGDSETEGSDT